MRWWLAKSEPSTYAFADLVRERQTRWSGVKNPAALLHLRGAAAGDRVVLYHTGTERAAVGLARVVAAPYPDPDLTDPKRTVLDLECDRPLPTPVTLAALKQSKAFAGSPLVREGRLSFLPLTAAQARELLRLAGVR
jgi:predicted RNA-binding protein with PUA-like domain